MSDVQFGPALRVLRVARGLTLRGMARLLNVSPAYLSQVENSKLPSPSHERIADMAKTLGIPSHRLFALASKIPPDVEALVEGTPEAAHFLHQALDLKFVGRGFLLLSELMDLVGADGLVQLLSAAHRDVLANAKSAAGAKELNSDGAAKVERCLHPELTYANLRYDTWPDVIDYIAEEIVTVVPDITVDDIAAPLTDSSYPDRSCVGGGVAIPHLLLPQIQQPILAVARLKNPVVTTMDPALRYVVVLLDNALTAGRHVRIIARVVQIFSAPHVLELMNKAPDNATLYRVISQADHAIG
ncbi:MAG: PTS sugar transporter subunit IIA [Myxococcales bacterium]|nr:PTS sugar transporter subunit IIA [Myxococcales bacterium]